jgi:hypothetical protein
MGVKLMGKKTRFSLHDDKDQRLSDAFTRAYKAQVSAKIIGQLIVLWGADANDFLVEVEIGSAVNSLAPLGQYQSTFWTEKKPKPKLGFDLFGKSESEPEQEPDIPYHLEVRRRAIRRWFVERLPPKPVEVSISEILASNEIVEIDWIEATRVSPEDVAAIDRSIKYLESNQG